MNNEELWLPVVGYEGLYKISDQGRLYSWTTFKPMALFATGRAQGYLGTMLSNKGRARKGFAHILVLEAFVGPRPEGYVACHNNGDAHDNRLINLRWDTISNNILDTVKHGRHGNKPACKWGHEYTPENTFTYKTGGRACRACMIRYRRDHKARVLAGTVIARASKSQAHDQARDQPSTCP